MSYFSFQPHANYAIHLFTSNRASSFSGKTLNIYFITSAGCQTDTHCCKGNSNQITHCLQRAGVSDEPGKITHHQAISNFENGKQSIFTTPGEPLLTMVYIHHLRTFVIVINYSGLRPIPVLHSKFPIDLNRYNCCQSATLLESVVFIQPRTIPYSSSPTWSSGSCLLQ